MTDCRSCGKPRRLHARGLCAACYLKPEVRQQHPKLPTRPNPGPDDRPFCVACGVKKVSRPRGLCCQCHADPAVRASVPSGAAVVRVRDFCGTPPLSDVPTSALPGTPEKVEAMALRAARGEQLFHPEDAR